MNMPRPAKPEELHRLTGTVPQATMGVGESRIPAGRPKFGNLPKECRPTFKRVNKLLADRQHLTEGDEYLVRLYAVAENRYWKFKNELDVHGWTIEDPEKGEIDNPLCKHFYKAENVMMTCLERLGLSPMSRDKAKRTRQGSDKPKDEFDQFLERGPVIVPFRAPDVEVEEISEGKEENTDEH
jgi:P27 family predicted phage terminase small subunit